ncbi:hypothetical protein HDU98_005895 [Podochytrium sp. JEL0797]|nr:hypothetical protein HDU98_005895 [Podochytrium sp. JEL0797]
MQLKASFFGVWDVPEPEPVVPEAELFCGRAKARMEVGEYWAAVEDCDVVVERLLESFGIEPVVVVSEQTQREIAVLARWRRGLAKQAVGDLEGAMGDYLKVLERVGEAGGLVSGEEVARRIRINQRIQDQRVLDEQLAFAMASQALLRVDSWNGSNRLVQTGTNLFSFHTDSDSETENDTASSQMQQKLSHLLTRIISQLRAHVLATFGQEWTPDSVGVLDPDTILDTNVVQKLLKWNMDSPSLRDVFRIQGWFSNIFDNRDVELLHPSCVPVLLPLLTSAVSDLGANTMQMGARGRITRVMQAVVECTNGFDESHALSEFLFLQTVQILYTCFSDDACLVDAFERCAGSSVAVAVWQGVVGVIVQRLEAARELFGEEREMARFRMGRGLVVPKVVVQGLGVLGMWASHGVEGVAVLGELVDLGRIVRLVGAWVEDVGGCLNADEVVLWLGKLVKAFVRARDLRELEGEEIKALRMVEESLGEVEELLEGVSLD